jgi:hypothetical protein
MHAELFGQLCVSEAGCRLAVLLAFIYERPDQPHVIVSKPRLRKIHPALNAEPVKWVVDHAVTSLDGQCG